MTGSFRLFIYGFGLCIGYLGLTDPSSLMYAAGQEKDGLVLVCLIIAVSILGLADLAANRRYHNGLPFLKRHRHFLLSTLAFCFLAQLFVAYASVRSEGILLFYIWPGLCTMGVAIVDAKKRKGELCGLL